jgi:hypothetical protein
MSAFAFPDLRAILGEPSGELSDLCDAILDFSVLSHARQRKQATAQFGLFLAVAL